MDGRIRGQVDRLRPTYHILLNERRFVVIHAHVSQLQLETITSVYALHPGNTEGEVPRHGGLRQKTCPRRNGRGWVKAKPGR
jgi:hypothetical protein